MSSLLPLPPEPAPDTPPSALGPLQDEPGTWNWRVDVAQELGSFGLWERDLGSRAGWWDLHTARLFGLSVGAQGRAPAFSEAASRIHPADLGGLRAAYRASLAAPGDHEAHYRVSLPDGTVRHLHARWRVPPAGDTLHSRVTGIVADETARLAASERERRHAQQLSLAQGLVGITLWRLDLALDWIQFDAAGEELFGLAAGSQGMPMAEMRGRVHPDDLEALDKAAARVLRGEPAVDVQARYRDAQGRHQDMLTRLVAQRDEQGRAIALLGAGLDMTQQHAERARSESLAARMDLLAEATGIGAWSRNLDTGERVWNGQMARIFDVPAPAVPPSLRELLLSRVLPDDLPKVDALSRSLGGLIHQARQAGPPPRLAATPADRMIETQCRIQAAGGGLRWLVLRAQVRWEGQALITHGVVIDVSASRAAQLELQLAQRRIELATASAGLGTWETDLEQGSNLWDAQMYRLRGLEPTDPRSIPTLIRELPPPEDDPQVEAKVEAALRSDGSYRNEFRVRWPDGSVRWLASRGMLVPSLDGRRSRLIGVNWDITEQKQAEQALRDKLLAEESNRAKSEFLARVSHELRTPMNAVLGFAELLCAAPSERLAPPERRRAELIRGAGRHLLALIDDMLDLARIDAGRLSLSSEPVALDAVVAEVVGWIDADAREAGVTVEAIPTGCWVRGDARALRQVVANLLSNGVKYNHRGGWVRVDAGPSASTQPLDAAAALASTPSAGAWILLRVCDNGPGLSASQRASAFEAFNRLGAEVGRIPGTGIGLAIVQQLIAHMGGRIEVHGDAGSGCEFRVWLPQADPPDHARS